MSVSSQIIEVLDDLCHKFGVAIDWTSENVMPYLEDLCGRYIQYEVWTSIAWCLVPVAVLIISGLLWVISGIVYAKCCQNDIAYGVMTVSICVFFFSLVFGFLICAVQAFDIIACNTIPEKVILEYIGTLLSTSSR